MRYNRKAGFLERWEKSVTSLRDGDLVGIKESGETLRTFEAATESIVGEGLSGPEAGRASKISRNLEARASVG